MIVTIKIDSVKVTSVRKAGLTIYDHDSCRLGTQKSVRCPSTEIVFTRGKKLCKFLGRKEHFLHKKRVHSPLEFFWCTKSQLSVIPYGCTCTVAICNL